jgi:hypothetical protein
MGFLQLFTGSNRGAPVTDDNPIPVKLPPGSIPAPEDAAKESKQDALILLIGALADLAWTSGEGSVIALLKTLATAALNTDPADVSVASSAFETVAASQTDHMLGSTGAAGDRLDGLLVIPATKSPGAVSIEHQDTNIPVFAGGADSVTTLHPFYVELNGIRSIGGGWEITTGANVSVIAFGKFT